MDNDTISRSKAISELMEMVEQHKGKGEIGDGQLLHWKGVKAMLESLPSAQPDTKVLAQKLYETRGGDYMDYGEKKIDDLISRQAVIDAVNNELDMIDHVPQWVFDRLGKAIKSLPSAQPRKKKEWIDRGKDRTLRWECPVCGRRDRHIYNFCPDCGEDLRR